MIREENSDVAYSSKRIPGIRRRKTWQQEDEEFGLTSSGIRNLRENRKRLRLIKDQGLSPLEYFL